MITDWLKKRLINKKQKSEFWSSFADVMQAIFEDEVEPTLQRVADRRSFFTMDSADLDTRTAEYGRFFVLGEVDQSDKAMLLMQRLDEIHFKGTERPIEQTFWREFGNLPVSWEPQYAPVDVDKFAYGSYFTPKDGISVATTTYGDFFLTSRGKIVVDLNTLYKNYGIEDRDTLTSTLIEKFDLIIAPLLPLHIVFDGVSLKLSFDMSIVADRIRQVETEISISGMGFTAKPDTPATVGAGVGTGLEAYRSSDTDMTQAYLSFDQVPIDAWLIDAPAVNTLIKPG